MPGLPHEIIIHLESRLRSALETNVQTEQQLFQVIKAMMRYCRTVPFAEFDSISDDCIDLPDSHSPLTAAECTLFLVYLDSSLKQFAANQSAAKSRISSQILTKRQKQAGIFLTSCIISLCCVVYNHTNATHFSVVTNLMGDITLALSGVFFATAMHTLFSSTEDEILFKAQKGEMAHPELVELLQRCISKVADLQELMKSGTIIITTEPAPSTSVTKKIIFQAQSGSDDTRADDPSPSRGPGPGR